MKKMKFLSGLMIVAILGLFTACEEEEAVGPSIDLIGSGGFISADKAVNGGDNLPFKWSATKGDAKLSTFTIYRDGTIEPAWNNVEIPNDQSDAYSASDTLTAPTTLGTFTYSFVVTDKDGLADTASVIITVESTPVTLDHFSIVLLGAQDNAEPSCASLETGNRYSISGNEAKDNSADVDIVHYNGAKDVALYAPSQSDIQGVSSYAISSWTNKNATKLSVTTLTATDFDDIETNADLASLGTPDDDFVGFLEVDDVILFETAGGKKGVFKVDALVDAPDGSVTINIKVEP